MIYTYLDLGYDGPEAYGISYKARGLCKDKSNEDIYDDDNDIRIGVTGSIIKSKLHHNVRERVDGSEG